MNRNDIFNYAKDYFGTEPEYLWASLPDAAVLRHSSNNKWYAVIMPVQGRKLGLDTEGFVDVINLKCDNLIIGSLRQTEGFFPAYHMNKEKWISALLGDKTDDELIKSLIQISFSLTDVKNGRKKKEKE